MLSCARSNNLDGKIQTIKLEHIDVFCACADWIRPDDRAKSDHLESMDRYLIFIEPADKSLLLPDTIGYNGDLVEFSGQFYRNEGYPENYKVTEEKADRARVFRYSSYKVIRSNYRRIVKSEKTQD
jgi:hypothetical protein